MTILVLLAMVLVFYFLLIRPQNKRRREQVAMQSAIEPGAKVITTAGMHATVVETDDDGVVLEIAPGVNARFLKQAIMQVVKDDADAEDDLTEDDDAVDDDAVEPADEAGDRVELTKETGRDAAAGATATGEPVEPVEPVTSAKGADKPSA
ncbi:preprotein translocase subunit YajC [Actinomadura parmotrematis]|nr:preprotein translocase subunit YajC [Actinomadura parmotrematis]